MLQLLLQALQLLLHLLDDVVLGAAAVLGMYIYIYIYTYMYTYTYTYTYIIYTYIYIYIYIERERESAKDSSYIICGPPIRASSL